MKETYLISGVFYAVFCESKKEVSYSNIILACRLYVPILSVLVSRASLDSAKRCTSHLPVKRRESHFHSRQSHAVKAMTGDTNHQYPQPCGLPSASLATERLRAEGMFLSLSWKLPTRHLGTNWRSGGNFRSKARGLPLFRDGRVWLGGGSGHVTWASSATITPLTTSPSRLQRANTATGKARRRPREILALPLPTTTGESVGPRYERRRATRGLTPTCCARETAREPGETSTAGDGRTVSLFNAHLVKTNLPLSKCSCIH